MSAPAAKRDHREESILHEMTRCKHFNGVQRNCCAAGVVYAEVRDESTRPFGLPCLQPSVTTCNKREHPSRAEVEAHEDRVRARLHRIGVARTAIVKATGGKRGVQGAIDCPNCDGGKLRYSVASLNGHICAVCSTEGCAQWME